MSEFVEVKTAELTGAALDWAVAVAAEYGPPFLVVAHTDHGGLPCPKTRATADAALGRGEQS
ncbi:hypothetical protein [Pseudomonas lactis]|uniref:hypothetical protein n=1 Tax=Pseudomonas lactis TaxID=1615674 RepID=UPI00110C7386|nr:hypothetical protein [Pseudomonas lactis]